MLPSFLVEGHEEDIPKTHSKHTFPTETKYPNLERKGELGEDYRTSNKHMVVEKYQRKGEHNVDTAVKVSRESNIFSCFMSVSYLISIQMY